MAIRHETRQEDQLTVGEATGGGVPSAAPAPRPHGRRAAMWAALIVLMVVTRVIVSQPLLQDAYRTQLDESYSIKEALAFGTGDLNPHRWVYPTLYPYLLAASYGVVYVVGHLLGIYSDLSHFAAQLFIDPRVFIWAGRAISLIAGIGCVLAVRAIAARVFGPVAGWTAAFGLALSPLHVKISAGAIPDMLAILFAVLAVGAMCDIARRPSLRGYLLAGIFIALGTGSKYWPIVLALVGVGLHAYLWVKRPSGQRPSWGWLVAAAVVLIAGFIATSPYMLLDAENVLAERAGVLTRFATGAQERPPTEAKVVAARHIVPIMAADGGWPWVLAALAGLVAAFSRATPARGVVIASTLLLLGVFARSDIAPADYLLPAFPFLWMLAGFAVQAVGETLGRFDGRRLGMAAAAVVLVIPLLLSARQMLAYSQTDTRTIGERLFHEIADDGDTVFVDFRSIHLKNSREDALRATEELEWFDGRVGGLPQRQRIWDQYRRYADGEWYQPPEHTYTVVAQDVLDLSSLPVYMIPFGPSDVPELDDFAEAGIRYIVFSEWIMRRHVEGQLPLARFYLQVVDEARLVGKVTPEDGVVVGPQSRGGRSVPGVPRTGPAILIYEVPEPAGELDLAPLREETQEESLALHPTEAVSVTSLSGTRPTSSGSSPASRRR
ncbi:MAG: phospholipid carrier-dependent glycosyltransferase [candidate division WS1 bacterium]|nr:phospholipid carrier-dependent glycosyltransferase [candidate division WS1 bacterium]